MAPEYVLGCRPRRMEALGGRHFAVEFGNEIRADLQCFAGASLCELGEEFAALRIASAGSTPLAENPSSFAR